jgi:thiol-disulfide isomerase/thioredoxin
MPDSRRRFLQLAGLCLAGVAGCSGTDNTTNGERTDSVTDAADGAGEATASTEAAASTDAAWRTTELTDVVTDETFSIADQPGPVLLHSFAVWCPKCARQHDHLKTLQGQVDDDVTLVSLNVDPNEDAAAVREYAADGGYDWRFVVAPSAVTESLVDDFSTSITSPPAVPIVIACPDGTASLLSQRGPKSTAYITESIDC